MKLHAFLAAYLAMTILSGSACALDARGVSAEGAFSRTLAVSGPVDLAVRTGSGDIQIRTGAPGTVQVRGRVRCWNIWSGVSPDERVRRVEADPPIAQSGNVIQLGATRGLWVWDPVIIGFDVIVPPDARVRTRSGSGAQIVGSVRGPVDASAGSGDIRIGPTSGNVRVSTGSGRIELEGSEGSVFARTGSGSIRAIAVAGELEVHTGSGNVAVDGEPAGSWNLTAASGNITVRLPASAAFDLDAHSRSGRIDSVHPIMVVGTLVGNVSRRQLRGQVRGGGPRIDVSTASGAIRIR
jgi:hypothetical protein